MYHVHIRNRNQTMCTPGHVIVSVSWMTRPLNIECETNMSSTTVTSDFLYRLFGPYLFRFMLHVRFTISFFKVSIDIRLSLDAFKVKETFIQ